MNVFLSEKKKKKKKKIGKFLKIFQISTKCVICAPQSGYSAVELVDDVGDRQRWMKGHVARACRATATNRFSHIPSRINYRTPAAG